MSSQWSIQTSCEGDNSRCKPLTVKTVNITYLPFYMSVRIGVKDCPRFSVQNNDSILPVHQPLTPLHSTIPTPPYPPWVNLMNAVHAPLPKDCQKESRRLSNTPPPSLLRLVKCPDFNAKKFSTKWCPFAALRDIVAPWGWKLWFYGIMPHPKAQTT